MRPLLVFIFYDQLPTNFMFSLEKLYCLNFIRLFFFLTYLFVDVLLLFLLSFITFFHFPETGNTKFMIKK